MIASFHGHTSWIILSPRCDSRQIIFSSKPWFPLPSHMLSIKAAQRDHKHPMASLASLASAVTHSHPESNIINQELQQYLYWKTKKGERNGHMVNISLGIPSLLLSISSGIPSLLLSPCYTIKVVPPVIIWFITSMKYRKKIYQQPSLLES